MKDVVLRLRSGFDNVDGDELGGILVRMNEAADVIEELQLHYEMLLSYLKVYDFLDRDPGGYLRQMLIDGEKIVKQK